MAPLAILVIGLHAALLSIPVRSERADHAAGAVGHMQVRLLTAPLAQGVTMVSAVQAPALSAEMPATQPAATDAVPAATLEPATSAGPHSRAAAADLSPPLPTFGLVVAGIDADGDYFPRALLSKAPNPLNAVVIDYPFVENDSGRYISELTLFIDESGQVARVRVDGASLPAVLEEAARRAFASTRFRAGEVDGRAVKSQIRIEVVFDSRPLDQRFNQPVNQR